MKSNFTVGQATKPLETEPRVKTESQLKTKPQGKTMPRLKARPKVTPSWAGRVPEVKPGIYADGLPIHQVEYLCCKMMLRPNHFTSRDSLF